MRATFRRSQWTRTPISTNWSRRCGGGAQFGGQARGSSQIEKLAGVHNRQGHAGHQAIAADERYGPILEVEEASRAAHLRCIRPKGRIFEISAASPRRPLDYSDAYVLEALGRRSFTPSPSPRTRPASILAGKSGSAWGPFAPVPLRTSRRVRRYGGASSASRSRGQVRRPVSGRRTRLPIGPCTCGEGVARKAISAPCSARRCPARE